MNLDRLTPVERALRTRRRIRYLLVAVAVVALLYYLIFEQSYVIAYSDEAQHFTHGSIGSETANGLPYWIFKALPELYKDELGSEGYARFGFLYVKEDDDLPIGFSRRVVQGIERVWLNCAVCHVGTYRETSDSPLQLILGAPANNLRLYDFIQFLRRVAVDSRFNVDNLITAINSEAVGGDLGPIERAIYRYFIVDRVREGLLKIREQLSFMDRQNDWGPGRVDTFNPYKAIQFNFPMDAQHISDLELNAAADYPSIWQQQPRQGMYLRWDGNNPSVAERNLSAALGAGVTPVTADYARIKRVRRWIDDLPAPEFPVKHIDQELAARGAVLYRRYCADCHGMGAQDGYDYDTRTHQRLGRVEPLSEIGTDLGRWASYTREFAGAQHLLYAGYPWWFKYFRKTAGYANHPLDGIWARSPYLHNGSVPTLRDLLEPADLRPAVWNRGSDVFDFEKVGYRYRRVPPGMRAEDFVYDTTRLGNGNAGHEGRRYGTELAADEKDALVEYMKTQ
jgi:hypothetical protein